MSQAADYKIHSWKVHWNSLGYPEAHVLFFIGKGGLFPVQYNYKGECTFHVAYSDPDPPLCPKEIIDEVYELAINAGLAKPKK